MDANVSRKCDQGFIAVPVLREVRALDEVNIAIREGRSLPFLSKFDTIFALMNDPNGNSRRYREGIYFPSSGEGKYKSINYLASDEFKFRLAKGLINGQIKHPKDDPDPTKVAHVFEEFYRKGNFLCTSGRIADTLYGRVLYGLYQNGIELGLSQRSLCDSVMEDGIEEMAPSYYFMEGADMVSVPAVSNAFPELKMDHIVTSDSVKKATDGLSASHLVDINDSEVVGIIQSLMEDAEENEERTKDSKSFVVKGLPKKDAEEIPSNGESGETLVSPMIQKARLLKEQNVDYDTAIAAIIGEYALSKEGGQEVMTAAGWELAPSPQPIAVDGRKPKLMYLFKTILDELLEKDKSIGAIKDETLSIKKDAASNRIRLVDTILILKSAFRDAWESLADQESLNDELNEQLSLLINDNESLKTRVLESVGKIVSLTKLLDESKLITKEKDNQIIQKGKQVDELRKQHSTEKSRLDSQVKSLELEIKRKDLLLELPIDKREDAKRLFGEARDEKELRKVFDNLSKTPVRRFSARSIDEVKEKPESDLGSDLLRGTLGRRRPQ